MISVVVHVLIIEDDTVDAQWAQRALKGYKNIDFQIECVDLASKAKEILCKKEFDVISLDLNLPDGSGLALFKEIKKISGKSAIVLFTGTEEEKTAAIEALHHGAQDYMIKGETDPIHFVRGIRFAAERNKLFIALEQKNKELEAFAHMVSHDLKQPLTVVKAAVNNLANTSQIPNVKKILNHQVDNMNQNINSLLYYASAGGEITNKEKIDLSLCVEGALKVLQVDIEREKPDIEIRPLPSTAVCKPLIELLFQNLISNAIKFKKQNIQPRILISSQSDKDFWTLSIKDNGMGIEMNEYKNNIFLLFHRPKASQNIPGFGIGLATCKKIVESHGGKIWYENNVDEGTTFYFTLPKGTL